jgi:hypothetical protein
MKSPLHTPARLVLAAGVVLACAQSAPTVRDPLPSWNETPPKKAIIAFVEKVTKEGSPDFVPVPDRAAPSGHRSAACTKVQYLTLRPAVILPHRPRYA